jgi:transmembrane sensor
VVHAVDGPTARVQIAAGGRWSSRDASAPPAASAREPLPSATPVDDTAPEVARPASARHAVRHAPAAARPVTRTVAAASSPVSPTAAAPAVARAPAAAPAPAVAATPAVAPQPAAAPAPLPPAAREIFARAERARVQGDARTASVLLQQILDRFPSDPRTGLAAFELGKVLMDDLGDPRGALRALEEALSRAPDAHFREHVIARKAQALSALGDGDRCRAARSEYLARYPEGVHAPAVRRLCP